LDNYIDVKKKEQLIAEVAILKSEKEAFSTRGECLRKEFAKSFNWYESKSDYGYSNSERKLRLPTWEEIFVEVGKLLAARNFMDYEGNISELQCAVSEIKNEIKEKFNHPEK